MPRERVSSPEGHIFATVTVFLRQGTEMQVPDCFKCLCCRQQIDQIAPARGSARGTMGRLRTARAASLEVRNECPLMRCAALAYSHAQSGRFGQLSLAS